MYVQIITFRLEGITPDEFAGINDWAATQYSGVPGLISKIFLADPDDDHAYGGVYLWETRHDAESYLRDGIAQVLVNDPRFIDVQARVLAVLPGPTSVTGGPIADLPGRGRRRHGCTAS
jgi:hypothetical protein